MFKGALGNIKLDTMNTTWKHLCLLPASLCNCNTNYVNNLAQTQSTSVFESAAAEYCAAYSAWQAPTT